MTVGSTPADLNTLLARTAAIGVTPQKVVLAELAADACAFVVGCLQTCQLPRVLSVTINGEPALQIEAAGGRILSILAVDNASFQAGFGDLTGRSLRSANEEDLSRVTDLFRVVFDDGQRIAVTTRQSDRAPDHGASGIAPDQVSGAFGVTPMAADSAARLDTLLAAADQVLIGLRTTEGETQLFQDNSELPGDLLEFLDRHLNDESGLGRIVAPDEILFLSALNDGKFTVALVHTDAGPSALIFKPGCCIDLAGVWADFPQLGIRLPSS